MQTINTKTSMGICHFFTKCFSVKPIYYIFKGRLESYFAIFFFFFFWPPKWEIHLKNFALIKSFIVHIYGSKREVIKVVIFFF